MTLQIRKITTTSLRAAGLDEYWLQKQIQDDPTILGLGKLEIVSREHRQPVGGRIDFLMRGTQVDNYYEVEIMLGTLDESHIIRTIEYWDVERQRRPQFDHFPVIVAEHITGRFFNVLRLLNRSVPMIAVQLSAFKLNNSEIVLHPVTVLNVPEETHVDSSIDPVERVDRPYWERNADPEFLVIVDKVATSLKTAGLEPRLTYNRSHIALASTGYNFCWFYPRVIVGKCKVECRVNAETRDAVVTELQTNGIEASPLRTDLISFFLSASGFEQHRSTLVDALKKAEDWSKR